MFKYTPEFSDSSFLMVYYHKQTLISSSTHPKSSFPSMSSSRYCSIFCFASQKNSLINSLYILTPFNNFSFFKTYNNLSLVLNAILSSFSHYSSTEVIASNDFHTILPNSKDIIWLSSYLTFCFFLKSSSLSYYTL